MEDIETEEIQDGIPDLESLPSHESDGLIQTIQKHKQKRNTRKNKQLPITVITQKKETYKEKIIDTILSK